MDAGAVDGTRSRAADDGGREEARPFDAPHPTRRGRRRAEAALVIGVLLAFAIAAALAILSGRPLTHDEAVYASGARSFVTGVPATRYRLYRPPGLPVLGTVGALAGWSDEALRSVTLVLAIASLAALWLLARVVYGSAVAALALGIAAGSPAVLASSWTFRNDIGAAGFLFAAMALAWHELERRDKPSRRLILVAPLLAGAFYIRYGALIFIAAVVVTATILWWRHARRAAVLIAATFVALAVLLVPHAIASLIDLRRPWSILVSARTVAHPQAIPDTFPVYLGWLLDGTLGGRVGLAAVVLAAAGVAVFAAAAVRRDVTSTATRALVWVLAPALVAGLTVLGSATAQVRLMIFPLLLLFVVGSAVAVSLIRRVGHGRAGPAIVGALSAAIVVSVAASGLAAATGVVRSSHRVAADQAWIKAAGELIRADSRGDCAVVAFFNVAVLMNWYGWCPAFDPAQEPGVARTWLPRGSRAYLVQSRVDAGADLPDRPAIFAEFRARAIEPPLATYRQLDGRWASDVFRLRPAPQGVRR